MALPRGLTILERSTLIAHPKPAPWHITTGVCNSDEIAAHVLDMNWSGYWFRHMCLAADILNIPCSDRRFLDDELNGTPGGMPLSSRSNIGLNKSVVPRRSHRFIWGIASHAQKRMSANAAFRYQRNQLHSHSSPSKLDRAIRKRNLTFLPS